MLEFWNFLSSISDEGTLVVVLWLAYKVGGIEKQLDNHIPTQIKDLKDSQKETKSKVDALSHIPTQIKDLKANQKEIRDDIKALDQKFDKTNQKTDQNFKEVVRLLSDRTG